jgi:hypothetical protein
MFSLWGREFEVAWLRKSYVVGARDERLNHMLNPYNHII